MKTILKLIALLLQILLFLYKPQKFHGVIEKTLKINKTF